MAVRKTRSSYGQKKQATKIDAWSYSRFKDYDNCPLKAKLKHVDKIKDPPNAAMERGSNIHKLCEDYSTGKIKKLPTELKDFKAEFAELKKHKKVLNVELQLAVNREWKQCDWFGSDAWLRIVLDAEYIYEKKGKLVLKMIDYKTGKIRQDNIDQTELYAPVGFEYHPEVDVIEAELWYLDQNEIITEIYTKKDAPNIIKKWEKKTKKMLVDTSFKPNPNILCNWCYFGQGEMPVKKKSDPTVKKLGMCKY